MTKRVKFTGKGAAYSYLQLPHAVVNHRNYVRMSAPAVKLVLDVYAQYKGFNNGDLCATWTLMQKRGWRSRDTLDAAKAQALHYGMIMLTRQGGRNKCSLYAITWKPINACQGKLDTPATKTAPGTWKTDSIDWNRKAWLRSHRHNKSTSN